MEEQQIFAEMHTKENRVTGSSGNFHIGWALKKQYIQFLIPFVINMETTTQAGFCHTLHPFQSIDLIDDYAHA